MGGAAEDAPRRVQPRAAESRLLDHAKHPFGMTPFVLLCGDPAQLNMPMSHPVFEWPRLFRRLPVHRLSPKALEELITGVAREKGGDDSTYLERFRTFNGMSKRAPVPLSAPTADSDHRLPPTVDAVTMLDARDKSGGRVYPIDDDDTQLSQAHRDGWEAYLRFQDVIMLVHTQRFLDPDPTKPLLCEDGTQSSLKELGTASAVL